MKGLVRYWGYIGLVVLLSAWWLAEVGPAFLIVLLVAVTLCFLIQAPVWCSTVIRDGTLCRRNASGLLLGCSYRQHKWQKLKLVVVPVAWRRLNAGLWISPATGLATIATVLGIVSSVAASGGTTSRRPAHRHRLHTRRPTYMHPLVAMSVRK